MAGTGVVLARSVIRGQSLPIVVADRPVEIVVASVSPLTVRVTVVPIDRGRPEGLLDDGILVPSANASALGRRREAFAPIRAGDLRVRFTTTPPTLHIETPNGDPVQRLALDTKEARITFSLGKGPLFGLGEGGPQFDRKGTTYDNRNGQSGFQLRTHGGRVPIQWMVSSDGWGMYIHRPLGAFDLSGADGVLTVANAPAAGPVAATGQVASSPAFPIDVFVTASPDPTAIMREYARITGFTELPPLWAFGYMQSHRTLAGPDEIRWVARTFRENKLPRDALIYLRPRSSHPPVGHTQRRVRMEEAPLAVTIYPGADGAFALYEDDGKTFNLPSRRLDAFRDDVG
jgi:alpha-glucosidase (family GH31 glycosyl hydrolase)